MPLITVRGLTPPDFHTCEEHRTKYPGILTLFLYSFPAEQIVQMKDNNSNKNRQQPRDEESG